MTADVMKLWKLLILSMVVMLSFAACSGPANEGDNNLETEDTEVVGNDAVAEDDGLFDGNKFSTAFTGTNYYEDWDLNDDNYLDENEFNESYYDVWDTNNDGILDENEWNEDTEAFGLKNETWANWDTDKNKQVDKNEFQAAFKNNNYYSTWDADRNNQLTEREFSDGLFSTWDDNDDGFVERDRYDTYYNRYFGD